MANLDCRSGSMVVEKFGTGNNNGDGGYDVKYKMKGKVRFSDELTNSV